jgi:hypothetical protein
MMQHGFEASVVGSGLFCCIVLFYLVPCSCHVLPSGLGLLCCYVCCLAEIP